MVNDILQSVSLWKQGYCLHRPSAVKAVLKAPNRSGKHARWWTRVYGSGIHEVDIVYRPGKHNMNADALSRSPLPVSSVAEASATSSKPVVAAVSSERQSIPQVIELSAKILCGASSFAEEQQKDAHLCEVIEFLEKQVLPEDPLRAKKIALESPLFTVVDGTLSYISKPILHPKVLSQSI